MIHTDFAVRYWAIYSDSHPLEIGDGTGVSGVTGTIPTKPTDMTGGQS